MSLWVVLITAISSLAANKLRAGLTLLGIVIGVAAVISLLSIGRGAQDASPSGFNPWAPTCYLFVLAGSPKVGCSVDWAAQQL